MSGRLNTHDHLPSFETQPKYYHCRGKKKSVSQVKNKCIVKENVKSTTSYIIFTPYITLISANWKHIHPVAFL